MKYLADEDRIFMSAPELIEISIRRSLAFYLPEEAGRLRRASLAERERFLSTRGDFTFDFDFELLDNRFRISISPDLLDGDEITYIFSVSHSPAEIDKEEAKRARGEAFLCAYALTQTKKIKSPKIKIIYVDEESGESYTARENPSEKMLSKFFAKLSGAAIAFAHGEIERVSVRLPSMKQIRFPYKSIRDGQSDFIESVYSAIKRKRVLFAAAPTGTGKTVSVLYPAIRAMGDGEIDKIFYLTSKTTGAKSVVDAIDALTAKGAQIRACQIIAKDRVCHMKTVCREDMRACPFTRVSNEKQDVALSRLWELEKTVVLREDFLRIAKEMGVCPYELSLDYSQRCDVIVCDYNYLFDIRVYLHRYFDEKGRYCFLIDEAHNLLERARELYSAELKLSDINALTQELPDGSFTEDAQKLARIISNAVHRETKDSTRELPTGEMVGFFASSEFPSDVRRASIKFAQRCRTLLSDKEKLKGVSQDTVRAIRGYYYTLDTFISRLWLYGRQFKTFYEKTENELSIKSVCLDPSEILKSKLSLGTSAVLFSATMHPLDYYKTVLGGDRNDDELEIPSPFDPERLCITVMDKIRTSYSAREESLFEICEVIYEAFSAKEGNYMVFAPSFAYAEAIHEAFCEAFPEIPTVIQKRSMSVKERESFLSNFTPNSEGVVGFCVLGGIYSEGIDLVGESLIGAIIVGVGIPQLSNEREAIREYFDDKLEMGTEYAYTNPGMNRVLQAAGRVIRREDDRGVIILIDERFSARPYRKIFPEHWHGLKYAGDIEALATLLYRFWNNE